MKRDGRSEVIVGAISGADRQYAARVFSLLFLSFVVIAYAFLLAGCEKKVKPGTAEVKRQAITGIVVTEVLPAQVDEYYETSGTVRARTSSVVASRVMGTVISLKVREGDRVRAGQVLITLDDRDMVQKVKAAEKAVEAADQNRQLADVTYSRYRKLYEGKAASKQEIDQIDTQRKVAGSEYERARAGLEEARVYHGFARITSPISGVVTEKKIDAGSMAVPGMPLLTIEDGSSLRLEVNVDEGMIAKMRVGMPVDILIDSPPGKIGGKISEIVPAVDPVSRTFLVKVSLPGSGLRPGQYAKAMIPVGKKTAILIPKSAIVEKGQLTGVYAVDDRKIATYRLVRVGKEYNGNVEILSGINLRDRIITSGVEKAVDGGVVTQQGASDGQ